MTTPERRAARADMTVRVYRLGEEPPETWLKSTTPAARLEMVRELSARMFEIAGQPAPSYTRQSMLIRVLRRA
jgi:hypothetical protein